MSPASGVVVVGACHAGFTLAASLREGGFAERVTLVDADPSLPYQRPPLSKAFLAGRSDASELLFRPESFYRDRDIDLVLGERVMDIDRSSRTAMLSSRARLAYDHLVLATGTIQRSLPVPGGDLDGVLSLRTAAQSAELRERLGSARSLTVVGGGFIGLEVASAAAELGVETTVVEAVPRVMARVVSAPVSDFFTTAHAHRGVRVVTGAAVERIIGERGRAVAVQLADGARLPADVVVVGIGVRPVVDLATDAGLRTGDGIEVDRRLRTSDERISAIGDCARFPNGTDMLRLESVQNATDHARCVAAQLVGRAGDYQAVPWFWSDQAGAKLQIAGLGSATDVTVIRGEPAEARFSIFRFAGQTLRAAESVNRPADHMAVRQLLGSTLPVSPEKAADPDFDLKGYARVARRRAA